MINVRVSVVVAEDDKLLLVRHFRKGRSYWVLPGGKLLQGEGLEECALREVAEECCLQVKITEFLWIGETIWPEGERHMIEVLFRGVPVSGTVQRPEWQNLDERADYPKWVSFEEVKILDIFPRVKFWLLDLLKGGRSKPYYLGNLFQSAVR